MCGIRANRNNQTRNRIRVGTCIDADASQMCYELHVIRLTGLSVAMCIVRYINELIGDVCSDGMVKRDG